jgi:hypothetical protein
MYIYARQTRIRQCSPYRGSDRHLRQHPAAELGSQSPIDPPGQLRAQLGAESQAQPRAELRAKSLVHRRFERRSESRRDSQAYLPAEPGAQPTSQLPVQPKVDCRAQPRVESQGQSPGKAGSKLRDADLSPEGGPEARLPDCFPISRGGCLWSRFGSNARCRPSLFLAGCPAVPASGLRPALPLDLPAPSFLVETRPFVAGG